MSSASSASRLDVHIGPSMAALRAGFYLHLVAGVLLILITPARVPAVIACVLLAVSWGWVRRHPALGFGPGALVRLAQREDGSWQGWFADGRESRLTVRSDTRLVGNRILFRYQIQGSAHVASRMFFSDEIDLQSLRRLRQAILATSGI